MNTCTSPSLGPFHIQLDSNEDNDGGREILQVADLKNALRSCPWAKRAGQGLFAYEIALFAYEMQPHEWA